MLRHGSERELHHYTAVVLMQYLNVVRSVAGPALCTLLQWDAVLLGAVVLGRVRNPAPAPIMGSSIRPPERGWQPIAAA
jgi:hypothetical protein